MSPEQSRSVVQRLCPFFLPACFTVKHLQEDLDEQTIIHVLISPHKHYRNKYLKQQRRGNFRTLTYNLWKYSVPQQSYDHGSELTMNYYFTRSLFKFHKCNCGKKHHVILGSVQLHDIHTNQSYGDTSY